VHLFSLTSINIMEISFLAIINMKQITKYILFLLIVAVVIMMVCFFSPSQITLWPFAGGGEGFTGTTGKSGADFRQSLEEELNAVESGRRVQDYHTLLQSGGPGLQRIYEEITENPGILREVYENKEVYASVYTQDDVGLIAPSYAETADIGRVRTGGHTGSSDEGFADFQQVARDGVITALDNIVATNFIHKSDIFMDSLPTEPPDSLQYMADRAKDLKTADGYFDGLADVRGTGVKQDFCRMVYYPEAPSNLFFSCGTGEEKNAYGYYYRTPDVASGFRLGADDYMNDVDGDKKQEYCRILYSKNTGKFHALCNKIVSKDLKNEMIEDLSPPDEIKTMLWFYEGIYLWVRLYNGFADNAFGRVVRGEGGMAVPSAKSKMPGAYFDGIDHSIRVMNPLNLRQMRGVCFWVWMEDARAGQVFFDFSLGPEKHNVMLMTGDDANLILSIWGKGYLKRMKVSRGFFNGVGKWMHICLTTQSSESGKANWDVYRDARLLETWNDLESPDDVETRFNYIGNTVFTEAARGDDPGTLKKLRGYMFDFRVYNTPMTLEKVGAIVNWGKKMLNTETRV
jgi:hypothetical protein